MPAIAPPLIATPTGITMTRTTAMMMAPITPPSCRAVHRPANRRSDRAAGDRADGRTHGSGVAEAEEHRSDLPVLEPEVEGGLPLHGDVVREILDIDRDGVLAR